MTRTTDTGGQRKRGSYMGSHDDRRPVRAIATKSEISSGSNVIISYSSTLPPKHRRRRNLFRPLFETYGSLTIISQLEGVARVVYIRAMPTPHRDVHIARSKTV